MKPTTVPIIRRSARQLNLAASLFFLLISVSLTACPGLGQDTALVLFTAPETGNPQCVHFTAPSSEYGANFVHNDYRWDFGDSSSGTWATTGLSKNTARGATAAHVYENPGTFVATVTSASPGGGAAVSSFPVTVDDPALLFAGEKTICISDNHDFTDAPADAKKITTTDLASITTYAQAGTRLLFRRGAAWQVTKTLRWPENAGPVVLGAFGPSSGTDNLGLHNNAPKITITKPAGLPVNDMVIFLELNNRQNWRVVDLSFHGASDKCGVFSGSCDFQGWLFLRLKITGGDTGIGWSHYNSSRLITIERMAVVNCDVSNGSSHAAYVGAEQLALLGNVLKDAKDSHVTRVWQAYQSVISGNLISGSSLENNSGRHALKLHGPGLRPSFSYNGTTYPEVNELGTPIEGTGLLANRTDMVVISDNVFGSSGPWPVAIGPQDGSTDSLLSRLVFERNRVIPSYGKQSLLSSKVQVAVNMSCQDSIFRNNILDGTDAANDFTGFMVLNRGVEPVPKNIELYHNTIYRPDNTFGNNRYGFNIASPAENISIKNNLVHFPASKVDTRLIVDKGTATQTAGNIGPATALSFAAPAAVDPLARDFHLQSGSAGINQGVDLAVVPTDYAGQSRPQNGAPDAGAFER